MAQLTHTHTHTHTHIAESVSESESASASDDDSPSMKQMVAEAGKLAQDLGGETQDSQDAKGRQSKNEKKARKAMMRLNLKEVTGECIICLKGRGVVGDVCWLQNCKPCGHVRTTVRVVLCNTKSK